MLVRVRRELEVRCPREEGLQLLDLLLRGHGVAGPVGNLCEPAGIELQAVHFPATAHDDDLAAALLQLGHARGADERAVRALLHVEVGLARAGVGV